MKNEIALQQTRRTTLEQQAHIIDESRSCELTREAFARPQEVPESKRKMSNSPQAALERLVNIARGDSGQCRIVGNFLLAWWNAAEYGGFDLTDVWAVNTAIAEDMIAVLAKIPPRSVSPTHRVGRLEKAMANRSACATETYCATRHKWTYELNS
jgi:hypothetical protein